MLALADRINIAQADLHAVNERLAAANEQLAIYIRQCAVLSGLPEDTPFDKPEAVFLVQSVEKE